MIYRIFLDLRRIVRYWLLSECHSRLVTQQVVSIVAFDFSKGSVLTTNLQGRFL